MSRGLAMCSRRSRLVPRGTSRPRRFHSLDILRLSKWHGLDKCTWHPLVNKRLLQITRWRIPSLICMCVACTRLCQYRNPIQCAPSPQCLCHSLSPLFSSVRTAHTPSAPMHSKTLSCAHISRHTHSTVRVHMLQTQVPPRLVRANRDRCDVKRSIHSTNRRKQQGAVARIATEKERSCLLVLRCTPYSIRIP